MQGIRADNQYLYAWIQRRQLHQNKKKGRTTTSSVVDQVMAAEYAGPNETTNSLSHPLTRKETMIHRTNIFKNTLNLA